MNAAVQLGAAGRDRPAGLVVPLLASSNVSYRL
jgi:hypothetical protein